MGTLRKRLAGAALAGMLMTGTFAGPALASGDVVKDDGKINVTVYKDKKKGKGKEVEHKNLTIKEATKLAAKKCDVKPKKLEAAAWKAEYVHGKSYACEYKKNKNTKLYVWFEDNGDKKVKGDKDKKGDKD